MECDREVSQPTLSRAVVKLTASNWHERRHPWRPDWVVLRARMKSSRLYGSANNVNLHCPRPTVSGTLYCKIFLNSDIRVQHVLGFLWLRFARRVSVSTPKRRRFPFSQAFLKNLFRYRDSLTTATAWQLLRGQKTSSPIPTSTT